MRKIFSKHPFFIRLRHWEYWNSRIIYAPIYPYWLWLSIRARSFFFLSAANPRIHNGGFIMESKMAVYKQMPADIFPVTALLPQHAPLSVIVTAMEQSGLTFPLIAKPDYGERGLGVKKMLDLASLVDYAAKMPVPFLIQAFVPYPLEAGVFFVRLPGEPDGRITGIVNKQPVAVTGDGVRTLEQLVFAEPRYILQWLFIKKEFSSRLSEVLANGSQLILVPYGNHSRGSLFTDETRRLNPRLEAALLHICNSVPAFNFGRLDILFKDWASLELGTELSVIELNGSGSEPTHIYDPGHSIFKAWREIARHWYWLYRISHHQIKNGTRSLTLLEGFREITLFRNIERQLSSVHW